MSDNSSKEKLNERQKKILEKLQIGKDISINDVAEEFNVHPMTIRRDLKLFEEMGIVVRTYGGARTNPTRRSVKYLSDEDINLNIEKKVAIARYVVENIIKDNDYIYLDSGSTILQVAKALIRRSRITVATNSIDILAELYHQPDVNTLILGGSLSVNSSSMHGPYAIQRLKALKVSKSILSCDAVVPKQGFFTNNDIEATLNEFAIETAEKGNRYIIADSTKIGELSAYKFANFKDFDVFVTDSHITDKQLRLLENDIDIAIAQVKQL
ncbi:MAG: DeoR family transcriptional regulator [Candidatus Lokiarchaeota archaeon]|nr:DeoR family transcriptional regulator [Candidatus Lokiarchaeota archaeon]